MPAPHGDEAEYGRIYERLMDDRQVSDYDLEAIVEPQRALADVEDAQRFLILIVVDHDDWRLSHAMI